MKRALLLVAHGSTLDGNAAAPVYEHLRILRGSPPARQIFQEFAAAFWKEEPYLHEILPSIDAHEVVVVPLFMAEGYFTEQVVPRELGLGTPESLPQLSQVAEQRVCYTPPVGTHPRLRDVVIARALAALGNRAAHSAHLVITGHGTLRNPNSSQAVHDHVARLREAAKFASVHAAFLDEPPALDEMLSRPQFADEDVVVVPFLAAEGNHTRRDIPASLPAPAPGAPRIHLTAAVGTAPEIVEVILSRAREALRKFDRPPYSESESLASRAHASFRQWASAGAVFGQLRITRRQHPWELRHVDDTERGDLRHFSDPHEAVGIARVTKDDTHRPLRTTFDLQTGWQLDLHTADQLRIALEALYPGAVAAWHLAREGQLRPVSFETVAAAQTGIYSRISSASPDTVEEAIEATCHARCCRRPMWSFGGDAVDTADVARGELPCPHPCGLLLDEVRRKG